MSTAWLRDLEEQVQAASSRLRELKAENERLTEQVRELEEQVAAAPDPEAATAWQKEREDVQQRVGKLVEHLGELLKE